ncbi:MAG: hypothetical protein A3J76_03585 [Candidatus Moranbacteria bacterium RBG_13_45_13]|nr:MAG: hypothetical protein A3J76_03585 [Candidatus Moranbacteria bacterium RBG_13_45_13]
MQKWDWIRFFKVFGISSIILALFLFRREVKTKSECVRRLKTLLLVSSFCWALFSAMDYGSKKLESSPAILLAYLLVNISFLIFSYFHLRKEK